MLRTIDTHPRATLYAVSVAICSVVTFRGTVTASRPRLCNDVITLHVRAASFDVQGTFQCAALTGGVVRVCPYARFGFRGPARFLDELIESLEYRLRDFE